MHEACEPKKENSQQKKEEEENVLKIVVAIVYYVIMSGALCECEKKEEMHHKKGLWHKNLSNVKLREFLVR